MVKQAVPYLVIAIRPGSITPPLGHVITGDLNIVSNPKLRDIFRKGPKYRLPRKIDWSVNYDLIRKGVLDCQTKWAKKNHVPQTVLDEWDNAVL